MAQSKLSNVDHDKSLECSICFFDFVQPKLLPCFHTFCLNCLKEFCRDKTDKAACPLCRREFTIPKAGVEKLPNNEFMLRLVLMKSHEVKKEESKCEVCAIVGEDVEAKAFCVECQQCLCARCQKYHTAQAGTKSHKVTGINEKPSTEGLNKMKTNNCLKHSGEEARIYCCDCSEVLCTVCHVKDHGKHNCKLIDEVIQEKKDICLKNGRTIEACLQEGRNKLKKLQLEREKTLSETTQASDIVQETCSKIRKLISSYETNLIRTLETTKANRLKEIESQEDLDQFYNTELNSFLSYSRMVMERGTYWEILRVADELNKRAEELIKSQKERNKQSFPECSIKFVASSEPTQENLKNLVGTVIETDKTDKQDKTEFLRSESDVVTMVKSILLSQKVNARGCGVNSVMGITVVDDQIFVVQQERSHVNVYDSLTLTAQLHINIPDMKIPQGLAGCSYNKALYVSDNELKGILRVKLSDKSIELWKLQNNNYSLRGLSVTSEQNLLVTASQTFENSYENISSILNYTSEGKLIRVFKLNRGMEWAWQTVQLSAGLFVTGHGLFCYPHRLCVINSFGDIIKSYGCRKGRSVGQLNKPCSLAIDNSKDNIFVADCNNNRVLLFSRDLTVLSSIKPSEKLSNPTSLCYDSSCRRLIIGEESGRLLVLTVL